MTVWLANAIAVVALLAAGPANAGPCRARLHSRCAHLPASVNFNAVPAISSQIVDNEPVARAHGTHVIDPTPAEKSSYTGPAVGISKMGHSPTVGYHWSID